MGNRVIACWIAVAALASAIGAASVQVPPGEATRLTADQRREVNKVLAQYRVARRDMQKRSEAVDAAIASGEPTVVALFNVIAREMHPQIDRYRGLFFRQAESVSGKQVAEADLKEIAELQQKVLGLKDRPDFSKELIEREGDPALKRLEEIFVIDRAAVLEKSESLREERDRLMELGLLWERCAVYLWQQLPDDDNKPKEQPSFEAYLDGEESLAVGLAAPMDPRTRQVLAANHRIATRLDPEEAKTILALNLTRNLLGLGAVAIDLRLCEAARDHSTDMQTLKFFSHESPVSGKKTPWDRAKRFGTNASAENIAVGYSDGESVNRGWFHSPGHHRNMLGSHKRVGLGRAGSYYTEMFGN